ncbi:MAG: YqgE/AlgH family protein [Gammaproteobacteria bacterium]|jgi:putative transcriptional regulator
MIRQVLSGCLLATGLLLWHTTSAQSIDRGTLLISTDSLAGTMFAETLVLVVHHDDDGSIGIMINRPTNLQPADVFPDIAGAGSYTGKLYFGGPLAPGRPFVLARRSESNTRTSIRIIDDVYLSGDLSVLIAMNDVQRSDSFSRIYAGSAQWGPGQLEDEISAGAWETAPANASLVFSNEPEDLWSRVMATPRGSDVARAAPARRSAAQTIQLAAE